MIRMVLFSVVLTILGCGKPESIMPSKVAAPPTDPATFVRSPNLGK